MINEYLRQANMSIKYKYDSVPGFSHLTLEEQKVVMVVHNHLYYRISPNERLDYGVYMIKSVKQCNDENYLEMGVPVVEVYFDDVWWHFWVDEKGPSFF